MPAPADLYVPTRADLAAAITRQDAVRFEAVAVGTGPYTAQSGEQIAITPDHLPLIAERIQGEQLPRTSKPARPSARDPSRSMTFRCALTCHRLSLRMTGGMDAQQRAEAMAWANRVHTWASWIEWTFTLVGILVGLVWAAGLIFLRAAGRAEATLDPNVFVDVGVPALIALGAGLGGYLAGLFASVWFRFMGHVVRSSVSIDARLEGTVD